MAILQLGRVQRGRFSRSIVRGFPFTGASIAPGDRGSLPAGRAGRRAEAIVRDDGPLITRREFAAGELPAGRITIAVSEQPSPILTAVAERLAELTGRPVEHVTGTDDHEIYLTRPAVLAGWVSGR